MKQLTVRFSELATLADCQLKYKLAYAEAMRGGSSARLVLGTAYHALMQGHYESMRDDDRAGRPRDLAAARAAAGARLNEYIRTHRHFRGEDNQGDARHVTPDVLDLLRWMYEGYIETYGTDPQWQFTLVEERRVVPIVTHLGVRVNLGVTADLIAYSPEWDRYLIVDHKTLTGRDAGKAAFAKENWLDLQRLAYAASFALKGPKRDRLAIFAAYHNTIRADRLKREMVPSERFGRAPVYFNETELNQAWEELQAMARDAVEIRLGRGRGTKRRMYASPNPQECGWKCAFKEVHLTARATGRDPVQVALDYGFERTESDEFVGFIKDVK